MTTNRPHYSWSQQSLFLASKLSFYKRYVLGETQKPNIRFEKGKEFANYKETGEIPHWVEDPLLEQVAEAVPRLDYVEHELNIDLFEGSQDIPKWNKPIKMFSDSCNKDFSIVYEYKTGKEPWTQQKVDDHEQLDFYAMLYYIAGGRKTIPKFKLFWIETEDVEMPNGEISVRYTGHVEEFIREFSEQDILNIMMKTMKTMQAIHEWEYNELEVEDDFMERYVDLLEQQEKISEELNLMKLEMETKMDELKMNYAVGSKGKFSFSERKNYSYSKELTNLKEEYDKEIKAKQSQEKKDGRARFTISRGIRFTKAK